MPKQNDLPSPVTYGQKFYAKAAGMDVDLPEAITPEQKYLKAIAEGCGGGGFTPTEAQLTAMNSGITSADVAQINTNKNNILLINQYDNELSHTGKNLYNYKDVTEGYYINSSGKLVANNALYTSPLIPVKANQSYTISSTISTTFLYVAVYGTTLVYTQLNASQTYNGFTFTPTEDCYMRFSGTINAKNTVQLEIGNSKTTFEKYTRYIKSDIDISEAQNQSPLSEYSYIKNCELVCNNDHINNSLVVSKYNQVDMGSKINKIMAKIKINDGSITGVAKAALIIGNNDTGHGISDITNKSIHVVFTRDKVNVGVFNNGTLSSENITYSAWVNGSTYEIGYELKGDDTLRVYLPDGTSSDITLQGVDLNQGQYAIYQQYNESVVATNQPTINTPQVIFKGFYCECQNGLPLKDNFSRPNGGLTVSPTGHTYKQFRNASTTDTDYDNTN
jgi:hypothetical protein